MASILIPEALRDPALDALRAEFEVIEDPEMWRAPDRLLAAVRDVDALMVRNQTRVTAEVLAAARRLRVVGRAGVGLDNIDVKAASDLGIVVTYAPDGSTNAVAELAIGFMLDLARMTPAADRDTRAGGWSRARFTGFEIEGKTLGLIGCGRIGLRTATKARAMGMHVVGYDPFVDPDAPALRALGLRLLPLDEVLAGSDFVSCHLPATAQTRGSVGYDQLSRCKPTAYFLNTARGEVVDEAGLVRALQEKKIAGAALDVRAEEPPRDPGPLAAMDNVILTPHVGAWTREGQARVMTMMCADVRAVLRGEKAQNAANFNTPRRSS